MREALRDEAIDDPERIAEVVIEAWSDHARRQGMADIADALADVIPDVGNFPGGGTALQIDEDGRIAGAREAAQKIEFRRFLQLALKPLGDLLERVLDGRARPGGLDHHRLDDEGRILVTAEPDERHDPADHRDDHQKYDQRAMLERQFRKIEPAHGSDPSRRTF